MVWRSLKKHAQGALQDHVRETFMPEEHTTTLLLVEDDPGHARLIERNLRRAHLPYPITVLHNGQVALDYVFSAREGQDAGHLPPCLVLLDLNLPGCSGIEVLARLKSNARTKHIPVIMFTTTDDLHEMEQCYALGCNAYFTKPIAYDLFVEVIQRLSWLLTEIAVPRGISVG
jgi:CheY-like chemotaxis protein